MALGMVLAAVAAGRLERAAHRLPAAPPAPAKAAPLHAKPAVPRPSSAPRVFALSRGSGAERELAGGETDAWEIDLAAGQYLFVTFDQRGIDVIVNVYGPDHRPLIEVDRPYGPEGAEKVHLVAETAGRYRLEVCRFKPVERGTYLVRIEALRPAGPLDRLRARAERELWEARGWKGKAPEFWEAVAKLERSLLMYERLGARDRMADAFYRLGKRYLERNRFRDALELFETASGLYRELHDRRFIALCDNQIGWCHAEMGEFESALPVYRRAMDEWHRQPPWIGEAVTLENLGELYALEGRPTLAVQAYRQAAGLWRAKNARSREAGDFNHLGWVYRTVGERQQALSALRQALELAGKDFPREHAAALVEMGNVFLDAEQPRRALPLFEAALKLKAAATPETLAGNLVGLGIGYRRTGDYARALAAYRLALDQAHAAGNQRAEANTWIDLGSAYLGLRQPQQAADVFGKALVLAHASGYRDTEAVARLGLACAARDRRNLGAALKEGQAALDMMEALRAGAARSDLQAHYLALHEDAYGFLVGILMQLHAMRPARGFDLQALRVSEQSRARGLLDDLVARRESLARPHAAAASLLATRESLLEQIAAKDRERRIPRPPSSLEAPKPSAAELESELDRLLEELREVSDEIRGGSPGSPPGNGALPRSIAELQRSLLDDGSVLLEYHVGPGKSYLWAVTAESLASFELPGSEQLEPLAHAASRQLSLDEPPASQGGGADPALRLSRILLGQVADRLGDRRLVIVPSGALHYVPFAALPDPGHAADPLMLRHEIVYVPSLAVLAEMRARQNGRPHRLDPIAVLADPVFGTRDDRAKSFRVPPTRLDPMLSALDRLPYSRAEAAAIERIAGGQRVLAALDFDASPELVTSGRLRSYATLHFATHGTLRGEPELSSLALSQLDRAGRPRDGWLRASQIAPLDLPAELVVLSGCETALGEELAGEGLIGLPQSFISAGAGRVLVSLWRVGDRSTAELMTHFYRGILLAKLPPAAALRAAQRAMWQDAASRAPSHWGAFVLEGDWR
jgi:CHAT domain-containing protein/tetratricopeptide (TPR) repeat protein